LRSKKQKTNRAKGKLLANRTDKRRIEKQLQALAKKAKQDMATWAAGASQVPTREEMLAWQAGYLAGINRLANEKEE
jgi:hypothetical protein